MSGFIPDLGPWKPFAPTFTNFTVGNGTFAAYYKQIGKTVHVRMRGILGSTSAITGLITATRPPGLNITPYGGALATPQGISRCYDLSATTTFEGVVANVPANVIEVVLTSFGVSGTAITSVGTSASSPMVWAVGDEFYAQYTYEAA